MKVFKSILNTIVNILIVLVLVVSVLVATLALTSKSSGISSIFGYSVQVIQSDSMKGGNPDYEGGDFQQYDVLICKTTKFDPSAVYEVGDIVTFKGELAGNEHLGEQLICHRIVDVKDLNGNKVYQTQGDNRKITPVPDQMEDYEYIFAESIASVYHTDDFDGKKLAGVGKVYEFINSRKGFFFCILLPMIIFFLYVLIKVVIEAVNYKNAKALEEREKNGDSKPANMSDEEYEQFKEFMALKNKEKEDSVSESTEAEAQVDESEA